MDKLYFERRMFNKKHVTNMDEVIKILENNKNAIVIQSHAICCYGIEAFMNYDQEYSDGYLDVIKIASCTNNCYKCGFGNTKLLRFEFPIYTKNNPEYVHNPIIYDYIERNGLEIVIYDID